MKQLLLSVVSCFIFAHTFALTTITTKKVNGSPFCGGATINVIYTVDAPANAGNVFTAQLSDKSGSFSAPVNIGQLTGTGSGSISATIPIGTKTGNAYKIRVVSSNPSVIGSPCPNALKINPKPTNVSTSGVTSCKATLNWTGVPTASSYQVQYKLTSSSNWSATINAGSGSNYTFNGLTSESSYDFQVRAACTSGAKSAWVKVTSATAACPVPTGVVVTDIGITTLSLDWNDASCVFDYLVRYKPFGITTWSYLNPHPTVSSATITGLSAATLYDMQVATRCSGSDTSDWSATVEAETEYFRLSDSGDHNPAFEVFPNPTTGDFDIQFISHDEQPVELTIQNVYGQVIYHEVKSSTIGLNTQKISLTNTSTGLHMITLKAAGQELHRQILVQ